MVNPPSTGGGQPPNQTPPVRPTLTSRMSSTMPNLAPPAFPYSARKAAPLDLRTVERKGDPATREPAVRNRPHALPEAPTFRPTEAEFRDPMEYIRSISERASKFGICKIVPPDSWNPDFAIDVEKFHFRTRRQELNCVDGGNRTNLNYLDALAKFHKQYGSHLNRFPSVDKKPLDLYKLKKAVEVRGGLDRVCRDKKWAEIGRDLGYSGKIMSSLSTSLKNSYQRWLHPYEEYLKLAKHGAAHQMEFEYPGRFSPATSQHQSPMNQPYGLPNGPSNGPPKGPPANMSPSPAVQATATLNASLDPQAVPTHHPTPPTMQSAEVARPTSSGFTAVNSGRFAAVNSPSGFTAVNSMPQQYVKSEHPIPPSAAYPTGQTSAFPSVNGSLQYPQGSPNVYGIGTSSNPLKRTLSHDSLNADSGSEYNIVDGDLLNGRRGKRARKDDSPGPMDANMQDARSRSKSASRRTGEKCDTCGKTDDQTEILLCESCELGYHKYCLDPPLVSVPEYEWHCSKCLISNGDYGFEEGGIYSLRQFQDKANYFKDHHFAQKLPPDTAGLPRQPTEDDVEREFWRLVENLTEPVEVEYGADIHSTTHGSGFPTIEKDPLNPYSKDTWNLNVLPFHEESLFRHIKGDISGMTVPWLYVGMVFSTFCWHNEDHYAYSANYQHFGSTKTWYGIPAKDAYKFEAAMRDAVPELFEAQPDLLFQLVTILPPDQLVKAGVEVYVLDQRAGEFVITLPQAYHAGFNHGFNFNEAVNFAPADWEPFGEAGVERLQEYRKYPCFSHDELLLTAAAADTSIKTAKWLAPALERLRMRELSQRDRFIASHRSASPHEPCVFISPKADLHCNFRITVQDTDLQEEEYQCCHCKVFTYMSQVKCNNSKKVTCLLHAEVSDCCADNSMSRLLGRSHELVLRYTDQDLNALVQKVVDRSRIPEMWEARLEKLLDDEARPSLRSLHTLLTEGEKIPYPLQGLDDLGDFVRRCDAWVEEANVYLTRKQQNRRKSEKASSWRRPSVRGIKADEKEAEPELTFDRMKELLREGDALGFQAAQFDNLQEKLQDIDDWRTKVRDVLRTGATTTQDLETLLDEGKGFMAVMPELVELEVLHKKTKWTEDAQSARDDMANQTLDYCRALLERAEEMAVAQQDPLIMFFTEMVKQGELWENKAKEVMSADDVHYPQLEALHKQAESHSFPVNKTTVQDMDVILAKNREAKRQIITLVERSREPDFRKRPMYVEVRDVVKALEELNGKPHGTADLERELKRHEDWMRKGKKLFGKANAPLHILEQHMKAVEETNNFCFDENDTFRPPVEPASRDASPSGHPEESALGEDEKPVFCICRRPEAGLMIECEICHDWYHAKCLKLARGKVKETDKFTCPICDWRVKIPRDAARPKLEDLQGWLDELADLPFQPEEEELLRRIVSKAQRFREFLSQYTNGNQLCRTSEEMPEMLFYLRKIEGAEVLLADETNIFRQELHKWQPIADHAPPVLEQSLSTRKPRPTKQQKLMREMGVEKVEDLPPHLRTKQYVRRKLTESFVTGPLAPKPSMTQSPTTPGNNRSSTPVGMPRQASTGNGPVGGPYEGGFGTVNVGANTPFGNHYAASETPSFPTATHSPLFSPATSQHPEGLREAMVLGARADPSFPLFSGTHGLGLDGDEDLRAGLANATGSTSTPAHDDEAQPSGDYDNMFMDMTHDEGETQHDPTTMPTEASQASEALDLIRGAENGREDVMNGDDGDGEGVTAKDFDDFITTGDDPA